MSSSTDQQQLQVRTTSLEVLLECGKGTAAEALALELMQLAAGVDPGRVTSVLTFTVQCYTAPWTAQRETKALIKIYWTGAPKRPNRRNEPMFRYEYIWLGKLPLHVEQALQRHGWDAHVPGLFNNLGDLVEQAKVSS